MKDMIEERLTSSSNALQEQQQPPISMEDIQQLITEELTSFTKAIKERQRTAAKETAKKDTVLQTANTFKDRRAMSQIFSLNTDKVINQSNCVSAYKTNIKKQC